MLRRAVAHGRNFFRYARRASWRFTCCSGASPLRPRPCIAAAANGGDLRLRCCPLLGCSYGAQARFDAPCWPDTARYVTLTRTRIVPSVSFGAGCATRQAHYMAGPEAKTKVLNTYFKGQTTGSGGGGVRAAPARELVRAGSGGHRRCSVHQTYRGLGATGKDDKTAAATTGQRQARNRCNRSVGSPEPFFQREHGATVMPDGLLATQINKIDATLRNGFPSSLNYQNQLLGTGKLIRL